MDASIFKGCIPALMTPCGDDGQPDFHALVEKATQLVAAGMHAVVYCGSMGDWPLLTDGQRQQGVAALVDADLRVIVGTGAQNTTLAADHAAHAQSIGADGLMVIPRVLSRGTSPAAQRNHFSRILAAAPDLPAVIYNSPYYGFETKADLFFSLRNQFPSLVGFKEFGGAAALSYASEQITSADDNVVLMAGVDTQVFHGFVHCGASGAITGIGNCLPEQVLILVSLCRAAANGDATARRLAKELDEALTVLSTFDEGPDLVLYYKYLLELQGDARYAKHFNSDDALSASQRGFVESQFKLFMAWWQDWTGRKEADRITCQSPAGQHA
ncbi:4-hydroxy-tetrahydrodipicolinate synthase [Rubripirellula tenax]|uniref:4-hydroxy-tetrahydrodipicolinate synthase n=1 Tax=Rubripirellula tenax TaxID=2528015 RepID=A0A5C6EBJ3_9BACT|nr:dihydrodipicolinate synthase family protein [Rubripirellula tenax]TWU46352.1 4-hydroxy-tetrahydrodipicolinate synthase [Rubripirellula tenax]